MKLVYFTDRDLRRRNAEAVHVLEVVRSLAGQGHTVELVTPVAVDVVPGMSTRVYGGGVPGGNQIRRAIQQLVIGPVTAARRMRSGDDDGMYVRLSIPLLLTVWLLRWGCGRRPLILEINGILRSELELKRRVLYAPFRPLEGLLIRQADGIVAASEQIRDDLVHRHRPERVIAVPNGVNPSMFRPQDMGEARRRLGLNETAPIIGFVGNFAPWHGVEVLLQALPHVHRTHPDARVMLVGGGTHREAIEAEIARLAIADHVDIVPPVSHEEIPHYINACSCCASPAVPIGTSDPGRNSLKVYEYLACGRPVAVSDLPGVAGIVASGRLGAVVTPGDPRALAEALTEILSLDRTELDRIRTDARSMVIEDFSWDANAARVAALFRECIAARSARSGGGAPC